MSRWRLDGYVYPTGARAIGWLVVCLCIVPIPLFLMVNYLQSWAEAKVSRQLSGWTRRDFEHILKCTRIGTVSALLLNRSQIYLSSYQRGARYLQDDISIKESKALNLENRLSVIIHQWPRQFGKHSSTNSIIDLNKGGKNISKNRW